MKRFSNLLKKEIKELVTKQLVISLALFVILFSYIGKVTEKEEEKASGIQTISVLNLDGSANSQDLLKRLESARFKILDQSGKTKEQALEAAKTGDSKLLLVIPASYGESLTSLKPSEIETYSFMRTFSLVGARRQIVVQNVIDTLNEAQSDKILREKLPGLDPASLKKPVKSRDFVVVRNRVAQGSAGLVAFLMMQQSLIIPIVLMMIVMYSSQMVISAVAMEKQDKTLETLLTVPIKRTSIITAKMLAAGLVGLISAGIYMFGYRGLLGGFGKEAARAGAQAGGSALMQKLGLSFSTTGYAVLGLALFLSILVALAMAMILGVLAEDFRSAQAMIMPLIFMVMIPYFISLLADINTVPLPVKIFIMLIPFSHPFLVPQNLYLGNWGMIAGGMAYMLVVFVALTIFAARVFSTDKVLTMKLRLGKKKPAVV